MERLPVLNIREFDEKETWSDFYSNRFDQHLKAHHKTITVPHKHDFFIAVLFTKGYGTHEIDFTTYEVKPGVVFFLKPGQTHNWELSHDIDGFIFFHSREFYELPFVSQALSRFPFFYSSQNLPFLHIDLVKDAQIQQYFEEINDEFYEERPFKKSKITGLLHLLYIALSRLYTSPVSDDTSFSSSYSGKLIQFEHLLEAYYAIEKQPAFYAAKMNMTTKHLNRIIRELTGKTTSTLISERVLLEAKRILVHSDDSFSSIARSLGYEEYAYFSRWFKQKTGKTPTSFSRAYKKQKLL